MPVKLPGKPRSQNVSWGKKVADDLRALQVQYGPIGMSAAQLLDVELVLTMLCRYLPAEPATEAWAVLNRYPFAAYTQLPPEGRRALAVARRLAYWLSWQEKWRRTLENYLSLSPPYRLYDVDQKSGRIRPRVDAIMPERLDVIGDALERPPPRSLREARWADPGRYRFYEGKRRRVREVALPDWTARYRNEPFDRPNLAGSATRQLLRVPLEELRAEAAWMDKVAPPDSAAYGQAWAGRLRDLELRAVLDGTSLDDSASELAELILNGTTHAVGLVGAGKSSLLEVLACYLARRGSRVTMVLGDVASLLRLHAIYEALRLGSNDARLLSVPLIGRSNRVSHLKRLMVNETLRAGAPKMDGGHPGYEALSLICPLDGLRPDSDPIHPGSEPCNKLYRIKQRRLDADDVDDGEGQWRLAGFDEEDNEHEPELEGDGVEAVDQKPFDCPLMPICPVHGPTRQLERARIWLATPAVLLASSPQPALIGERLQNLEMVLRASDVVLVDEADLVQVQLDATFAPAEDLTGRPGALLDRMATDVASQIYPGGRPLIGHYPELDRWLVHHENLQRSVDRLLARIRNRAEIRRWLTDNERYFYGDQLLAQIGEKLRSLRIPTAAFDDAKEAFTAAPLSPRHTDVTAIWDRALTLEVLSGNGESALSELRRWLHGEVESAGHAASKAALDALDDLTNKLLTALTITLIEHSLENVLSGWASAAEHIDIDRGTGGLFYRPQESLAVLVPEAPMGTVIGLQYIDSAPGQSGQLRFLANYGLGRYLLYHLHDVLADSHGISGPHVLLTSGTSWAPGSWKYNLHLAPTIVLRSKKESSTDQTRFFFEPIMDPGRTGERLMVSGAGGPEQRMLALRSMINYLASRDGATGKSQFDRELEQLAPKRRRILIVVGTYEEAQALGDFLAGKLEDHELVVALERDRSTEEDGGWSARPGRLPRSMLKDFARGPAQFLIAPLQAIERGHNILVPNEQLAAIGAVYFLARPMPVPGDPAQATQKVNSWAMHYIESKALLGLGPVAAARKLRVEARRVWHDALADRGTYANLDKAGRTPLLWTQLVLVTQCIGRAIRGGVDVRVHFIDAAWAEKTAEDREDDESTSMLLGLERILEEVIARSPVQAERELGRALYGPLYEALRRLNTVYRRAAAADSGAQSQGAAEAPLPTAGTTEYGEFEYTDSSEDGDY